MEPQTVVLQRKIVGVLIRAAREKARRTTAQLAQRLGVTPGRTGAFCGRQKQGRVRASHRAQTDDDWTIRTRLDRHSARRTRFARAMFERQSLLFHRTQRQRRVGGAVGFRETRANAARSARVRVRCGQSAVFAYGDEIPRSTDGSIGRGGSPRPDPMGGEIQPPQEKFNGRKRIVRRGEGIV